MSNVEGCPHGPVAEGCLKCAAAENNPELIAAKARAAELAAKVRAAGGESNEPPTAQIVDLFTALKKALK